MDDEEDIAAALPRPPLPAPARREAAIAEALRRFDGAEAAAPPPGERARPAAWWPAQSRPWAGAFAGAFLVALVGLPFVWSSLDDYTADEKRAPPPGVEAPAAESPAADADVASPPLPGAAVPPVPPGTVEERSAAAPLSADSTPAAAAKAEEPGIRPNVEPLSDSAMDSGDQIVVTGSRIRNPNLTSSSPITVAGGDGEPEDAIAAFDRAIEIAPGSATAYLNRGLAWQRTGNLDRALADLDRAVRIDSRSARVYYHRSRILRERGDRRRAQADEERAVALDPTYEPLVRAQRRQRR